MNSKPVSPIFVQSPTFPNHYAGPQQLISVREIPRKRRSGSCETRKIGQPFITPKKENDIRRSFFRANSTRANPKTLIHLVDQLSPSQAFRVSMLLTITPPNLNSLKSFVSKIPPQDQTMINSIKKAIFSIVKKVDDQPPADYGFIDCRFSFPPNPQPILPEPVLLGDSILDFQFKLPHIPPNQHILMQPFIVGQMPPTVAWPNSLRIFVNNFLVKPPGFFPFSHIDLTRFGPDSTIRIICNPEPAKYNLLVRFALYISFEDIVQKIQNERQAINDTINPRDFTIFSQMTGNIIDHPGRGIQCIHTRCFDIKEYIERCSITQQWFCPICRQPVFVGDLVYSVKTKECISELTKANLQDIPHEAQPVVEEEPQEDIIDKTSVFDEQCDPNMFRLSDEDDNWDLASWQK